MKRSRRRARRSLLLPLSRLTRLDLLIMGTISCRNARPCHRHDILVRSLSGKPPARHCEQRTSPMLVSLIEAMGVDVIVEHVGQSIRDRYIALAFVSVFQWGAGAFPISKFQETILF